MEVSVIISIVSVLVALFVFIMNWNRGTKALDKDDTTNIVSIKADLKFLSKQLEGISTKLEKLEDNFSSVNSRLTKNEINIETLFKKYKDLEKRIER